MITNDYTIPFHLITSEMVTSLGSDNHCESLEGQTKIYSQDINIMSKPFKGLSESIGSQCRLESNLPAQEQSYDVNLALHMSTNSVAFMNLPPPAPHNMYSNSCNSNNNITINKHNRRNSLRGFANGTLKGYDSDDSNKSYLFHEPFSESDGTKHKISRNGHKFRYEHAAIYSNYRYNNDLLRSTFPLTHHSPNGGINRTRLYTSNGKRPRREYNRHYYSNEITRRVHGLMERFTSIAKFFQIGSLPPISNSQTSQLDQAIWDLFTAKAQTKMTYFCKLELWKKVYLHITKLFSRYGLFMVGSTMSGLGTESSDIDMCLLLRTLSSDPRADAVRCLDAIRSSLESCDFIKSPEVIHAKVPILKFKSAEYGFEVDLNCNNDVGIRNTHLLHCYSQLDWRVRPLVIIVKLWAQANCINNAKNMTISSYSLALMVIHFLQCGVTPPVVPCLHGLYQDKFSPEKEIHDIDIQEELPPFHSDNNQSLGELLLGFLQYYAYFNYETYAISVRLASRVLIDDCRYARSQKNDPHQWKYLCIEEPFDLTNTARSVYDLVIFKRIQKVFQDSFNILRKTGTLTCILTTTD